MSVSNMSVPAKDDPTLGWLWGLTTTDRPRLANPWTITLDGEPWTVATEARIMALRKGDYGFTHASAADCEAFGNVVRQFPTGPAAEVDRTALAALVYPDDAPDLPPCDICRNTGEVECDECDGTGETECSCRCGHEHTADCKVCDGNGTEKCECGRKGYAERLVTIGAAVFNLALFRLCLKHLPDAPLHWRQAEVERLATIECGEWLVAIMPMRVDRADKRILANIPLLLNASAP